MNVKVKEEEDDEERFWVSNSHHLSCDCSWRCTCSFSSFPGISSFSLPWGLHLKYTLFSLSLFTWRREVSVCHGEREKESHEMKWCHRKDPWIRWGSSSKQGRLLWLQSWIRVVQCKKMCYTLLCKDNGSHTQSNWVFFHAKTRFNTVYCLETAIKASPKDGHAPWT